MMIIQILLFLFSIPDIVDCNSFNNKDYNCGVSTIDQDNRYFQTPQKGSEDYKQTYQDMNYLVGYAQIKYSSNKKICIITFITKINT